MIQQVPTPEITECKSESRSIAPTKAYASTYNLAQHESRITWIDVKRANDQAVDQANQAVDQAAFGLNQLVHLDSNPAPLVIPEGIKRVIRDTGRSSCAEGFSGGLMVHVYEVVDQAGQLSAQPITFILSKRGLLSFHRHESPALIRVRAEYLNSEYHHSQDPSNVNYTVGRILGSITNNMLTRCERLKTRSEKAALYWEEAAGSRSVLKDTMKELEVKISEIDECIRSIRAEQRILSVPLDSGMKEVLDRLSGTEFLFGAKEPKRAMGRYQNQMTSAIQDLEKTKEAIADLKEARNALIEATKKLVEANRSLGQFRTTVAAGLTLPVAFVYGAIESYATVFGPPSALTYWCSWGIGTVFGVMLVTPVVSERYGVAIKARIASLFGKKLD